jgi:hypothetical protein
VIIWVPLIIIPDSSPRAFQRSVLALVLEVLLFFVWVRYLSLRNERFCFSWECASAPVGSSPRGHEGVVDSFRVLVLSYTDVVDFIRYLAVAWVQKETPSVYIRLLELPTSLPQHRCTGSPQALTQGERTT